MSCCCCEKECCRENKAIPGVVIKHETRKGKDRDSLVLKHADVKGVRGELDYPNYFEWGVTGDAGGYIGLSNIQVVAKDGGSFITYTLSPAEAAVLKEWLNKHVSTDSRFPSIV